MSFQSIRHAQQAIWPTVRLSLARQRASREAVANNPNATVAARARARVSWNHVVANESVWALAHANLLLSEQSAAVIAAAREWAKSWEDCGPPDDFDPDEDRALYAAVQELASSLHDIDDDELLTDRPAPRTVQPSNNND